MGLAGGDGRAVWPSRARVGSPAEAGVGPRPPSSPPSPRRCIPHTHHPSLMQEPLSLPFLKKYIAFAKQRFAAPELSPEASDAIAGAAGLRLHGAASGRPAATGGCAALRAPASVARCPAAHPPSSPTTPPHPTLLPTTARVLCRPAQQPGGQGAAGDGALPGDHHPPVVRARKGERWRRLVAVGDGRTAGEGLLAEPPAGHAPMHPPQPAPCSRRPPLPCSPHRCA